MPKIDKDKAPVAIGTRYPPPHDEPCRGRHSVRLSDAAGLTQFGANLTTLPPGCWSSQRHWHTEEDEFVYVISGEVALIEDDGETLLRAGDSAGFKGGVRNGHHFVNKSAEPVVLLMVGSRLDSDQGEYADIDMRFLPGRYAVRAGYYRRKNGDPI